MAQAETHLSDTKHVVKQPWYLLKVYGGERRWLAGCLLLAGGPEPTFQLRPLNVFFTEKPDEEVAFDFVARIQTFFHPDARPVSRDFWAR